jgi:hypothetical protein
VDALRSTLGEAGIGEAVIVRLVIDNMEAAEWELNGGANWR